MPLPGSAVANCVIIPMSAGIDYYAARNGKGNKCLQVLSVGGLDTGLDTGA